MKDLTAYLAPDHTITLGQWGTFTLTPPDQASGLKLAAIVASGMQLMAGASEQPSPEVLELLDGINGPEGLQRLALGDDTYEAMLAARVPAPHVERAAQYALYLHVLGEAAADDLFDALHGAGGGASGEPQAPSSGPSTASERPTRTASTPRTGESRPRSARNTGPRASSKDAGSRGDSSSTAGT